MCGGRLPFSDLRLCVEQKFFCADWCVIHIVYAHFPIHNLSNSLCPFGAMCAHRTIPGVFAHRTTLVSCVFNAECTSTSFSVYCKLPQSLLLFFVFYNMEKGHQNLHTTTLVSCVLTAQCCFGTKRVCHKHIAPARA